MSETAAALPETSYSSEDAVNLDYGILLSAIGFLVTAFGAVLRVAWSERERRITTLEEMKEELRKERISILESLLNASSAQKTALASLTDAVDESLRELLRQDLEVKRRRDG